jgi:hypothetical protein
MRAYPHREKPDDAEYTLQRYYDDSACQRKERGARLRECRETNNTPLELRISRTFELTAQSSTIVCVSSEERCSDTARKAPKDRGGLCGCADAFKQRSPVYHLRSADCYRVNANIRTMNCLLIMLPMRYVTSNAVHDAI